MKVALISFFILTSLWFGVQEKSPDVCRGKALPITLLPGPKMTGPALPLRFGGIRDFPRPPIHSFPTDKPFRLVIKTRDEFSDLWNRFTAPVPPGQWAPPLPEVDFSTEFVIVAAMGTRPMSGYWIIIDGACEVDGHVEVFVSSVEDPSCTGQLQVLTNPADAVRIPRTDLPIVFRENQIPCTQWINQFRVKPVNY